MQAAKTGAPWQSKLPCTRVGKALLEVLGGLVTEAVELTVLPVAFFEGPHERLLQVLELLLQVEVLLFSELLCHSFGA